MSSGTGLVQPPGPAPADEAMEPDRLPGEEFEDPGLLARAAAFMLDLVILAVLQLGCLYIPIAAMQQGNFNLQLLLGSFFLALFLVLLSPLVVLFYFVLFHGNLGQTPGKMLMGLWVVTVNGEKISTGLAFLRAVGFLLSTLPCGAGLLWALIDPRSRGWHDHLALTRVIRMN